MECATCGQENPEHAKFCLNCAAPMSQSPGHATEERKIVTVVFCDLVGFTAASDEADPEDVRARLVPYHRMLRSEIERFGGTVEKFIGDAVMAVFGAPTAHEDDAERAVRSALRVLDAIEELNEAEHLGLTVRIGINTGEAVVALQARPERGEGFVTGDVVNTASRLQGVAPVGAAVVGEQTYLLTRSAIGYEELPPVEVKGKKEPVAIWRVLEATARLGSETDRTDSGPFVGRADELELLRRTFSRALRERAPQLVVVTGEPGVGKSRLLREFGGWVDDLPDLVTWRQGRCLPYGDGVTFWALGEIVKAHAGIFESDPPDVVRAKLENAVEQTIEIAEDREWMVSRLAVVVGASDGSDEGEVSSNELFTAWRRFFEGITDEQPLVLIFEDLHWADPALLAFVEALIDQAADAPILLIGTARPELRERHPEFARDLPAVAWLPLSSLTDTETAELVGGLLGAVALPAEVQQVLLEHAAGNPLFAEQFTTLLLDKGILTRKGKSLVLAEEAEIPVPGSVTAIISARLDTLEPDRKALLHDAAVVGKVFWTGAVAKMGNRELESARGDLHGLSRKEFVRRSRRSSVEGDEEYGFWHALTRDTAYAQIPKSERAAKHMAAADWIEQLAGEGKADQADLLAYHLGEAFDLERGLGRNTTDLEARLRAALSDAADRLRYLDATAALERYRRALGLTPPGVSGRGPLLRKIGGLEMTTGHMEQGRAIVEQAIPECAASGHHVDQAKAMLSVATFVVGQEVGGGEAAELHIDRAMALLEEHGSEKDLLEAYTRLATYRSWLGRPEDGLAWVRKAERLLQTAALGAESRADVLDARGYIKGDLGDRTAIQDLEGAREAYLEAGLQSAAWGSASNLAFAMVMIEGPFRATDGLLDLADAAGRRGFGLSEAYARSNLCDAFFDAGRWDECLTETVWQAEASVRLQESEFAAWSQSFTVMIAAARGDADSAAAAASDLATTARDRHAQAWIPGLTACAIERRVAGDTDAVVRFLAEIADHARDLPILMRTLRVTECLRLCRWANAVGAAEILVEDLELPTAPRLRAAILTARATLAEMRAEYRESLAGLDEAVPIWQECGCVVDLAHARAAAGRNLIVLGRLGEGREQLLAARETFASLEATQPIEEIDEWIARATARTS